ncbi:MAG: hypothetical protein ACE5H3_03375 [Planctomycetota bacterium]
MKFRFAALFGLGLALQAPLPAVCQGNERVSLDSQGMEASGGNRSPDMTSDGRFVVFASNAPLVPNSQNSKYQIYVRDRQAGTTTLASINNQGVWANQDCELPHVSDNGRFVVYQSESGNLSPIDDPASSDIFLRDLQAGITKRMSLSAGGNIPSGESFFPEISGYGRFVVFATAATNFSPLDNDSLLDVYLRDRDVDGNGIFDEPGGVEMVLISVNSRGKKGNSASQRPCISADGRFVAFQSYASNLVPKDDNGFWDLFLRDRDPDGNGVFDEPGSVRPLVANRNSFGFIGDGISFFPAFSSDGRFVAFLSSSKNLIQSDTNGVHDIFLFDRISGTTILVNRSQDGGQTGRKATFSTLGISPEGRWVAYASGSRDIVPGDTNRKWDLFLFDRVTEKTVRVDLGPGGVEADGTSGFGYRDSNPNLPLGLGGRFIAFSSEATNLVPGDTNGLFDIFVRDRGRVDALILSGPASVAVGNTATVTLGGAPANLPFRLMASGDLGGSFLFDHPFDLGPGFKTIATGITDGAGNASWTSGPVPAKLAGRTFFLEARVDESSGLIWNSPPLRLDVL